MAVTLRCPQAAVVPLLGDNHEAAGAVPHGCGSGVVTAVKTRNLPTAKSKCASGRHTSSCSCPSIWQLPHVIPTGGNATVRLGGPHAQNVHDWPRIWNTKRGPGLPQPEPPAAPPPAVNLEARGRSPRCCTQRLRIVWMYSIGRATHASPRSAPCPSPTG